MWKIVNLYFGASDKHIDESVMSLYFGTSDKHIDESVMSFFSTVIAKNGLSPHGVTNPAECNWYLHRSENPKSKIRRNL